MKDLLKKYSLLPFVLVCSLVVSALMFVYPTFNANAGVASLAPTLVAQGSLSPSAPGAVNGNVILGEYSGFIDTANTQTTDTIGALADALNGTSIEPGASFSFNEATANIIPSDGYEDTSQVATALYVAALQARCEIVTHQNNLKLPDYATLGFDAQVSPGGDDLQIKNPTAQALTITANTLAGELTLKIIGKDPADGITVRLVANYVEGTPGEATKEAPEDATPEKTPEDEAATQVPEGSYAVEAFRLHYQDGQLIETESLGLIYYL
jgi:hypothetical protein